MLCRALFPGCSQVWGGGGVSRELPLLLGPQFGHFGPKIVLSIFANKCRKSLLFLHKCAKMQNSLEIHGFFSQTDL